MIQFRSHSVVQLVTALVLWSGCSRGAPPSTEPTHADGQDMQRVAQRAAYIAKQQQSAGAEFAYVATDATAISRLSAKNPIHGFHAELDAAGARIVRPSGALTLRLSAWGCAGALQPLNRRMPQLDAPGDRGFSVRAEYADAQPASSVAEWYVNGPLGLEQGFTVAAAPACAKGDANHLRLQVAIDGAQPVERIDVQSDEQMGKRIELRFDAEGKEKLLYSDLSAQDAVGNFLPTAMRVEDGHIVLDVDVRNARYPITIDPLVALEQDRLIPNDGDGTDAFGQALALSGNVALVADPEGPNNCATFDSTCHNASGAVYAFTRSGTRWTKQAKLVASDPTNNAQFGNAIAMSGDLAAIAAIQGGGATAPGAVYLFQHDDRFWFPVATLTASDKTSLGYFGMSVAMKDNLIAVGALFHREVSVPGSVYLYDGSSGIWRETKIFPSDTAVRPGFGYSVALSADTLVVGAPGAKAAGFDNAGMVFIYVLSGTSWVEQARLTASDAANDDNLGLAVALSGDTVIVGASNASPGGVTRAGAAYVFTRSGTTWTQQAKLTASSGAIADQFGYSVAIDKDTAMIGAPTVKMDFGYPSGAVYLFSRSGTTWSEQSKIMTPPTYMRGQEYFGTSVAIDANMALIGAPGVNSFSGVVPSAAYSYQLGRANGDSCTANSDCASNLCIGGTCGRAQGAACGGDFECRTGFCTDGVCCNSACSGGAFDCQACSAATGAKTDGVCSLRDVNASCADANPSQCLGGGICDGSSTSCQLVPSTSDTICNTMADPARCIAGYHCDGKAIYSCYVANAIPADANTICNSNGDSAKCIANYRCDGTMAFGCPSTNPTPASSFTVCSNSSDASKCIANYRCDGTSTGFCPVTNPGAANSATVCSNSSDASKCIANYRCDGTKAGSCPNTNPTPASNTTLCSSSGDASQCITGYRCDGTNAGNCPNTNPTIASAGTACAPADDTACTSGGTCTGTSTTCRMNPANFGTVCRKAAGECDVSDTCSGSTLGCPSDGFKPDDTSCEHGTCQAGVCRPESDLAVALSANPQSAKQQEPIVLHVEVKNHGQRTATQAVLTIDLPTQSGFSVADISAGDWICQSEGATVNCSRSEVAMDDVTDIALTIIPPLNQTSFAFHAKITSAGYDFDLLNNDAQLSVNNVSPCSTACDGHGSGGGGGGDSGSGGGSGSMSTGCQIGGSRQVSSSAWLLLLISLGLLQRRRAQRLMTCALLAGCSGGSARPDGGVAMNVGDMNSADMNIVDPDGGIVPPACAGISLSGGGAANVNLRALQMSGTLTLNGQTLPDATQNRGAIQFIDRMTGAAISANLGASGPASIQLTIAPGSYDVRFVANAALCSSPNNALPCIGGVLQRELSLQSSGSASWDLRPIVVTGSTTLNGSNLPTNADANASLTFTNADGAQADTSANAAALSSYRLVLLPGIYKVDYRPRFQRCSLGNGLPCVGGTLKSNLSLSSGGNLPIDIASANLSGTIRIGGSDPAPADLYLGSLLFALRGGGSVATTASGSGQGLAPFSLTLLRGTYDVSFVPQNDCTGNVPCIAGPVQRGISVQGDGSVSIDVPSITVQGAVTVNGAAPGATENGTLRFALSGGGQVDTRTTGPRKLDSYALRLLPGTYAVSFVGGPGCPASPARTPCNSGLLRENLTFSSSGSLSFDVPAVTVSGQIKVNGQAVRSTAGEMLFTPSLATSSSVGIGVIDNYSLRLLPGSYALDYRPIGSGCASTDSAPCMSGRLRDAVSISSDGVVNHDIATATIGGQVTLGGAALASANGDRGRLRFLSVDGKRIGTTDSFGTSGAVNYQMRLFAGTYTILHQASPSLCQSGFSQGGIPCTDQYVAGCP